MKKTLLLLSAVIFCSFNYAQWNPSLTLDPGKSFASISAFSDKIIWAVTYDFIIYNSADGGNKWNKIIPKGFGLISSLSVSNLYAINSTVALLSVDSIFTGVGPGFIYRTSDGGRNWTKVFAHRGNCDIKIGMFDKDTGLVSCSFSGFNGSIKSGQELFYTKDGGRSWKLDPINPSNDYNIVSFATNRLQVAMCDFNRVYFSNNEGRTWAASKQEIAVSLLQFENSSYAAGTDGFTNLLMKRPGRPWLNDTDSLINGGLISGLVLDGSECWIAEGFDKRENFYSFDSGKNFTAFYADSSQGFVMMTKARKGKTVIGATPPFASPATLWLNARRTTTFSVKQNNVHLKISNKKSISNASLDQNVPNPYNQITKINFTLPQTYTRARIILTDKAGNVLKEVNVSGVGKGSVQIDASTLVNGTYQYSLIIADGKCIATKQMMIIK